MSNEDEKLAGATLAAGPRSAIADVERGIKAAAAPPVRARPGDSLGPVTMARMRAIVGDRDPRTVRLELAHQADCLARKGRAGLCTCDPDVREVKPKIRESKLARRVRRRRERA